MTCAAPDRSRTSVKPPVDAPASRHRRPATRSPGKAASAPASFAPPRDAYCASRPASLIRIGSPAATWVAGLPAAWPATSTRPSATRLAACSRDRASPLLTSSASSRLRVPIRFPGRRSAAQLAWAVVRHRPLTLAGVAQGVREPLVNALEDRRVLGDRQPGQVLQLGDRLVHPAVAGGRPRAGRLGRARGIRTRFRLHQLVLLPSGPLPASLSSPGNATVHWGLHRACRGRFGPAGFSALRSNI